MKGLFMSKDCDHPKVVSTILYTEGSVKVNREVELEKKVPDPTLEAAQAAIRENQLGATGLNDVCTQRIY